MALKKKFITIQVPALDTEVEVMGTPEFLDKKTIKLDLTRKLRGKSLEAVLKIFNNNEELTAYPQKLQIMKFYIRRMMRKRVNYVEDSFETQCKDIRARIKPLLITRKKVSRAVRRNLRNTAKEFLTEFAKNNNFIDICKSILEGDLQKELLPKLKKVYPLSFCDIRIIETKEIEKADLSSAKSKAKSELSNKEDTEEKSQIEELEQAREKIKKLKQEKEAEEETEDKTNEDTEEKSKSKKKTKKVKKTKKATKKKKKKKSTKK